MTMRCIFPLSAKQTPDVAFEMIDLLFQMENYTMAQSILDKISFVDNQVDARKYAWKGIFLPLRGIGMPRIIHLVFWLNISLMHAEIKRM